MRARRAWAMGAAAGAAIALGLALACAGCTGGLPPAGATQPVTASRQVLGTVVTVTAWGPHRAALESAVDGAFSEMARVEAALDPYDATSTVAVFNAAPYEWHVLPASAVEILGRVEALRVGAQFSPALFGVTRLYDFGGAGSVPSTQALAIAVMQAGGFVREGLRARFAGLALAPPPPGSNASAGSATLNATMRPGLDLGGAAKGYALDRAMARLRRTPDIEGAMISAGSSTIVWGRKSDGEPWSIGVEDPRDTGGIIGVVSARAPDALNISTSGDYQLFFERGGVRYHHILDPTTGRPARGFRSLTVYGSMSGVDADILSTALFVMGPAAAKAWARDNGVGLFAVDDRGRVVAVSAPASARVSFERQAAPKP